MHKVKILLQKFNAGTYDWFGNPRDFKGAIWVDSGQSIIGTDEVEGKKLSELLRSVAASSLARREAINRVKEFEMRRDPDGSIHSVNKDECDNRRKESRRVCCFMESTAT